MPSSTSDYQPRNPKNSDYYSCVETHFEELETKWDEYYAKRLGFWRPHVSDVILKYLDCGDLHCGFARVKCKDCGHSYLLPFSCKRRHFCPSCHQRRIIEFGEHLCENILKKVPHRHWVFSIPKRLRIYFLYDRTLLTKLSRSAWKVLKKALVIATGRSDAVPAAVIAVHTFGDFLGFNPHLHILASDGCFWENGTFIVSTPPETAQIENLFRLEIFKLLKKEGRINDFVIENMLSWHHSGFNIFRGSTIWPDNTEGMERLAQYIIRASFSQERMQYLPIEKSNDYSAQVIYKAKDGKSKQTFDALDWLAMLTTHIPNKNEQTIKYYGFYSNKKRGQRIKNGLDGKIENIISSDVSKKAFRKSWARLIQKVYKTDPLICPECKGEMKIIAFIEDLQVIRKILVHLGLWETHNHDPPERRQPPDNELTYDDFCSQIPPYGDWV